MYKNCSFSFITLLSMPRLSKHERSGTIGMLKPGAVSDVACNCQPSTIQRLRDGYQANGNSNRLTPVSTKNCDPIKHIWDELGRRIRARGQPPRNVNELNGWNYNIPQQEKANLCFQ